MTTRLRLLSPQALLERLDDVASTSGARDLPERQRTMRATLAWSYAPLSPDQPALFTLLGVFRAGARLEHVEELAAASGLLTERDVVHLVGPAARRAEQAHAEIFVALAERAAAGYEQADQVAWLARSEAEEANLLVAIRRSLDDGDGEIAARIIWSLWLYWWLRGQTTVGRQRAERCLAVDLPPALRAEPA